MAPGRYGAIAIGVVTPGLDNIYRLVTGNPGTGSRGQMFWTTDAGQTWYPVRF